MTKLLTWPCGQKAEARNEEELTAEEGYPDYLFECNKLTEDDKYHLYCCDRYHQPYFHPDDPESRGSKYYTPEFAERYRKTIIEAKIANEREEAKNLAYLTYLAADAEYLAYRADVLNSYNPHHKNVLSPHYSGENEKMRLSEVRAIWEINNQRGRRGEKLIPNPMKRTIEEMIADDLREAEIKWWEREQAEKKAKAELEEQRHRDLVAATLGAGQAVANSVLADGEETRRNLTNVVVGGAAGLTLFERLFGGRH